uniref:Diapause hormone and pheromone biosynthesis activating neuropeptide n=1 Tax=Maruca vitrata TaxID=497515 RepID=M9P2L6_MARVT|nr:diapause hormone and pheromone biosynthesis activating neuropeptide precursor [Maruca vitrata]AGI96545.1 diapause hormone and pheromone biosynthesis activating neuropeptide precursor [Maruca vitrata]
MSSLNFKVLFYIFFLCGVSVALDDSKDEVDRGASDRGGLWFGPRLGKRSLRVNNDDNRQTFLRLLEAADALKYYYDQLPFYDSQVDDPETRVTKKVVFTPKLGRSIGGVFQDKKYDNVEFTPRLGRRIPDALPVTPSDDDVYSFKPDSGEVDRRTSYFNPRLGRKVSFSPRLGRELTYDIYPEKIRLARSANDSKAT